MNGAESLVRTAETCGIGVCFANPGTTEMPLVAALDSGRIRTVLALFEGVVSGAADGYARIADSPAMTLLHLGPGFANSIANFHNARRARSAVLSVIGDHATWHVKYDAPLTSDIVSLARPVSGWIRSATSSNSIARDTAEAIAAAGRYPGRVATLIAPADCQWDAAGEGGAPPIPVVGPPAVPDDVIKRAASAMRRSVPTVLFLGGAGLRARSLAAAARIAEKTGCALMCETFPARMERGAGYPALARLPYFPEQALEALAPYKLMILVGAPRPVAFFGYPNAPSVLIPEGCESEILAEPEQDVASALEALADELGAPARAKLPSYERAAKPSGPLIPPNIGAALGALIPENAILMDEGATTGFSAYLTSAGARPHTYLALTGGAIGQGLPCATGAAVAAPDRKVIALQADGGGMYTLQALWTDARESLDITTIICNNRSYRILQVELARAGITEPGPKARSLTMLDNPELNWVEIARGMGVPGVRVNSAEELVRELERALAERGPNLIEMMM